MREIGEKDIVGNRRQTRLQTDRSVRCGCRIDLASIDFSRLSTSSILVDRIFGSAGKPGFSEIDFLVPAVNAIFHGLISRLSRQIRFLVAAASPERL
jgi:hypothetical protein